MGTLGSWAAGGVRKIMRKGGETGKGKGGMMYERGRSPPKKDKNKNKIKVKKGKHKILMRFKDLDEQQTKQNRNKIEGKRDLNKLENNTRI